MEQKNENRGEAAGEDVVRGFTSALFNFFISGYYLDLKTARYTAIGRPEAAGGHPAEDDWARMDDYIRLCIHPDDRAAMTESTRIDYIRERLQREPNYSVEVRDHGTGSEKWYRYTTMRGSDADHAAICFTDVTEQVQQRLELERLRASLEERNKIPEDNQASGARESRVIEALSASYLNVYMIDIASQMVEIIKLNGYVTKGLAREKAGPYPYEATCRAYIAGRVYEEDRQTVAEKMSLPHLLAELKDKDEYEFTYRASADGKISYYQGKYVAVEGGYIICGFQNIDEMIAAEKARNVELEAAKKAAEAASAAKTAFLFNMSHDIRTPMNAIMGFRDLLEAHQDDPVRRADYLAKIKDASTVLLSIINNVLEMARIEKGTLEIEDTVQSAEQFGETIASVFREMMREKNITFTHQNDVRHPWVYCDPAKLREIFINILSNACKYTEPGGSVSVHLEELPSERAGWVLYRTSIADTGIGMSEEFLPHIFEEFSREHTTTDIGVEGTGLGMPIVKRLVNMLGGTIEVRSKQGEGSCFIVTIPHRLAEEPAPAVQSAPEEAPRPAAGRRILLAEDNDLNAEIAMEILGEAGFLAERARDGAVCADMLQKAPAGYYDVILMDIQMPNMNGYEAARAIRAMKDPAKANISILAMTANAFEEDKRAALEAGMNGHLAKPINVPELLKTLAGILG